MAQIEIEWKKFDRRLPDIITKQRYNLIKHDNLPIMEVKLSFFRIFKRELLLILLGIISGLSLYKWTGLNEVIGLVCIIFLIAGFFEAISLIISSISFFGDYITTREEIKKLQSAISNSNSYEDFCIIMSKTNQPYIMHLSRINNH